MLLTPFLSHPPSQYRTESDPVALHRTAPGRALARHEPGPAGHADVLSPRPTQLRSVSAETRAGRLIADRPRPAPRPVGPNELRFPAAPCCFWPVCGCAAPVAARTGDQDRAAGRRIARGSAAAGT